MNVKENSKSIFIFVVYSLLFLPLLYIKLLNVKMFVVFTLAWVMIGIVVLLAVFASRKAYTEKEELEHSPYDECQRVVRNKYAYSTLIMVFVFVLLESLISAYFIWAEPITRTMVVLCVPYIYYITNLANQSALMSFVSKKNFTSLWLLFIFDILLTVWIIRDIYLEGFNGIIKDGIFQNNVGILIYCILSFYGTLALYWEYRESEKLS